MVPHSSVAARRTQRGEELSVLPSPPCFSSPFSFPLALLWLLREHFICAGHSPKQFVSLNVFNPHSDAVRWVVLLFPFLDEKQEAK